MKRFLLAYLVLMGLYQVPMVRDLRATERCYAGGYESVEYPAELEPNDPLYYNAGLTGYSAWYIPCSGDSSTMAPCHWCGRMELQWRWWNDTTDLNWTTWGYSQWFQVNVSCDAVSPDHLYMQWPFQGLGQNKDYRVICRVYATNDTTVECWDGSAIAVDTYVYEDWPPP